MSFPSRFFAMSLLLVCSCFSASALEGCYVTLSVPQTRIFTQQYPGSQNNPVQFFSGTEFYDVNCPAGANAATTHPGNITASSFPSTKCWADWIGPGTNVNNAGNYRLNGTLVTFDLIPCPIDDLIPLLVVGSAGLGVVTLRRSLRVGVV